MNTAHVNRIVLCILFYLKLPFDNEVNIMSEEEGESEGALSAVI